MILFFYGANSYAARAKIAELKAGFIAKNGNDFGLEQLDGAKLGFGDLRQQLQASPFLAGSRLIVIEDLGKNKTVSEQIVESFDDVPSTTIAVFYDAEVDKRGKYFKAMSKLPRASEFKPLAPPALRRWMTSLVQKQGAKMDEAAVTELLNRCGDDQWRLESELTKLADYKTAIGVDDVKAMVEASEEQNVFMFLGSVMSRDLGAALHGLEVLRQQGQNEMYILTMILWQLGQVLMAKVSGAKSSNELASKTKMAPYAAGKALALANKIDKETLVGYYNQAVDAERGIKTGQAQPDELLDALVVNLCS